MSKFSYDDLPWDVAEQLQILDLELSEGDITQKGYDKKKAQLLAPFESLIEEKSQFTKQPIPPPEPEPEPILEEDLGPEPSAADVTDFLDFLPSPTHSPVDHDNEGAALMEQNHKTIATTPSISQLNDPTTNFNPVPPPALPPHPTPTMSHNRLPQQQPRPFNNNNNFRPTNFNNRPPPSFDPRMGPPRPPIYAYPGRPPMNGFRPPPHHHASSPQLMYRPQPQQQQQPYPYRPNNMPPPPTPTQIAPSLTQHSRSPSLDSKPPRSNFDNRSTFDTRSNFEEPDDWGKENYK